MIQTAHCCEHLYILKRSTPAVANVVMDPQVLHCTSVFFEDRRFTRGDNTSQETRISLLISVNTKKRRYKHKTKQINRRENVLQFNSLI